MRYVLAIVIFFLFISCETETESVPKYDPPKIDSSQVKGEEKLVEPKPLSIDNNYAFYEEKLKTLPQVIRSNNELKSQNKDILKTKVVDKKSDSLFSIKFGRLIDTNFISQYEFYINKKSKAITVYDRGEDRMIPLDEWKELNE